MDCIHFLTKNGQHHNKTNTLNTAFQQQRLKDRVCYPYIFFFKTKQITANKEDTMNTWSIKYNKLSKKPSSTCTETEGNIISIHRTVVEKIFRGRFKIVAKSTYLVSSKHKTVLYSQWTQRYNQHPKLNSSTYYHLSNQDKDSQQQQLLIYCREMQFKQPH
jgi:hypothetical protein